MSIEKMKLVNIIGPIGDFDRVVMRYVIDNNIHLEDIFSVFVNTQDLYPFTEPNPYDELMRKASEAMELAGLDPGSVPNDSCAMCTADISACINDLTGKISEISQKKHGLRAVIEANQGIINQVGHISSVSVPLKTIFDFQQIKIRFGRMPRESYKKLNEFLGENFAVFFFKFGEDQDGIYGMYCVPVSMREKVDSLFSSLYFERMRIPDKATGSPKEVIEALQEENRRLEEQAAAFDREIGGIVKEQRARLLEAYNSIYQLYEAFNVRRFAAHTRESFYIAGWMPEQDAIRIGSLLEKEPAVTFLLEEPGMAKHLRPPTKLKNNFFTRPFESFVKMYGLPAYNELDPTTLFALTYSLMFGMMYGDVGHGLVLSLVGALLQRRGSFIGPVLKICGIAAGFFGILFGSVFGFELNYHFMYKPMAADNMMTTLIMAVGLGTVIIGIAMLYNIANGIKQGDIGRILFDSNGVAGFVFYWAIIAGVLLTVSGHRVMTTWYILLFVVVPLILVFLKEPLAHLLARRPDWLPKNKGSFLLENFFELFELLLSYITNTISFIRVGAFALNHAGMMMVVYTLANVSQHSLENLSVSKALVLLFGNALVIGLEGLLVAIQVLRLEFYEMFSRYFTGTGRPFVSRTMRQKEPI